MREKQEAEKIESYSETIEKLVEVGVVSAEVGDEVAKLVGLRNLIAHRYWEVDDSRIYREARGSGLEIIKRFVRERLRSVSLEIEERERFRFFELKKGRKEALLRKIVNLLENREEVFWAFAYGSFLRDVPFRDVDIAVYVDRDVDPLDFRFRLGRELSRAIGLPVDVKVINRAPPWFIIKVINEGRRLVEKVPLLTEKLYLKAIDEKAKIASA